MVRPPCSDRLNFKKRGWTGEEDAKIFEYVPKNGIAGNIETSMPKKSESSSGMKRCVKSCRTKWSNESFTQQEEELIIKLHAAVGTRWPIIAHQLPGRSENDIKNHWNSKLKKRLSERGIDPVTHKPFSQILADYNKIGGLSRAPAGGSRYIGTIKRDLKKVASFITLQKPETSSSCSSSSYTFTSNSQDFTDNFSHFQTNFANHDHNNNENIGTTIHSLDLLSQLQAISLVTEGTTKNPADNNKFPHLEPAQFGNSSLEYSAAYNNSNNNAGQIVKSPESFSWHDFLLDEAGKSVQQQEQEQEVQFTDIECHLASSQLQLPATKNAEIIEGYDIQSATSSTVSSHGSSFLEAMLDQENDMFLNFPGLMEEPLY